MKSILKAFRDALVADSALIAIVPATSIFAGVRNDDLPIPGINVFIVTNSAKKKYGGKNQARMEVQVSIFTTNEDEAQTIKDLVTDVLLSDNTILNTAGVRTVTLAGSPSLLDPTGLCHIPARFSCQYMFTV
jgi:hypothetical protein